MAAKVNNYESSDLADHHKAALRLLNQPLPVEIDDGSHGLARENFLSLRMVFSSIRCHRHDDVVSGGQLSLVILQSGNRHLDFPCIRTVNGSAFVAKGCIYAAASLTIQPGGASYGKDPYCI